MDHQLKFMAPGIEEEMTPVFYSHFSFSLGFRFCNDDDRVRTIALHFFKTVRLTRAVTQMMHTHRDCFVPVMPVVCYVGYISEMT